MMQRQKIRLLFPNLQRRILVSVLVCAGTCIVLAVCVTAASLAKVAAELPNDGDFVMDIMPSLLGATLLGAALLTLPAFGLLALLITMPIVGASYRLRCFLEATANGEQTEDCKLRSGDPFQQLCQTLNKATAAQREINAKSSAERKAA